MVLYTSYDFLLFGPLNTHVLLSLFSRWETRGSGRTRTLNAMEDCFPEWLAGSGSGQFTSYCSPQPPQPQLCHQMVIWRGGWGQVKVFDSQMQMSDPLFYKRILYEPKKMNSNRKEPAQVEAEILDSEVSVWTVVALALPCGSLHDTSGIPGVPWPQFTNPWTGQLLYKHPRAGDSAYVRR